MHPNTVSIECVTMYAYVVTREPLSAADMSLLLAICFCHRGLQYVQKAVIPYLQKQYKLTFGFTELVQIVKHDLSDVRRKHLKDDGVGSRVDSGFRELSHPLEWRGD